MLECAYCSDTFDAPDDARTTDEDLRLDHVFDAHDEIVADVVSGEISPETFSAIQRQHVLGAPQETAGGGADG